MPLFSIELRNSEYYVRDDDAEYDNTEAALSSGVHSAVRMAADEITRGRHNAAIEVTISRDDGIHLLSSVVAISVSPIITAKQIGSQGTSETD